MKPPLTHDVPERGFKRPEFEQRLLQAQQQMETFGIDILLLTTEADIRYYTGYLTQFWQSPTRPWFLLLPQSGQPVAVIPSIGAATMARTWITDIRTWPSPHPDDDGITLLADTLTELAGLTPGIGLAMGRETHLRMPLRDYERLISALPSARWRDATGLLQSQRQIKSPAEVEKIHHVAQIVSAAFAHVPEILSTGLTEIEAFRRFKIHCLELGVDDTAYLVGGAGPGGYDDIISPPSSRTLSGGDILILDTGCTWDGYFCDFDRNFAIQSVNSQAHDAYQITWEATEAGLAIATPGTTCSELFHAMNKVMARHAVPGDGDVGRLGHGLGTQLTESPSITPFDHTELRPGMVMTLEPGFTFANGKMMVHEENILIRDGSAELLTRRAAERMPSII